MVLPRAANPSPTRWHSHRCLDCGDPYVCSREHTCLVPSCGHLLPCLTHRVALSPLCPACNPSGGVAWRWIDVPPRPGGAEREVPAALR
jgi:hypothetical protein